MSSHTDTVDMLVAAHTLERAMQKSSEDGVWRVVLCPEGPEGSMLKRVLSASTGGCGRSSSKARVAVAAPVDGVFQTPGDLVEVHRAGWARKGAFRSAELLEAWANEIES